MRCLAATLRPGLNEGVDIMARMTGAVTTSVPSTWLQAALATAAAPEDGQGGEGWSIDRESADASWYESSRLLRRGLQVDEDPPREAIPTEWQWRWWLAARTAAP